MRAAAARAMERPRRLPLPPPPVPAATTSRPREALIATLPRRGVVGGAASSRTEPEALVRLELCRLLTGIAWAGVVVIRGIGVNAERVQTACRATESQGRKCRRAACWGGPHPANRSTLSSGSADAGIWHCWVAGSGPQRPASARVDPYRPAGAPLRAAMLTKAVCASTVACAPRARAFLPSNAAPAARPRVLPLAARRQRVVAAAAASADTKYPSWDVIYNVRCLGSCAQACSLLPSRLQCPSRHASCAILPCACSCPCAGPDLCWHPLPDA